MVFWNALAVILDKANFRWPIKKNTPLNYLQSIPFSDCYWCILNAKVAQKYRISDFLHFDIIKYQPQDTMWTFLANECSERAKQLHIVSSGWFFTISIRGKNDYLPTGLPPPLDSLTLDESNLPYVYAHIGTSLITLPQKLLRLR